MLIEDNAADAYLVEEAFACNNVDANLLVVRDGDAAIQLIDNADVDENAPCPRLFLLDLNLPTATGDTILAHIRSSKRCAHTPVIIVTSSDSPQDRALAKRLGANRYFRKPTDYDEFMRLGEIVNEMISESGRHSA